MILWFFNCGLLPEVPEDSSAINNLDPERTDSPYPVALLVQMYKAKRSKMHNLLALSKFEVYANNTPGLVIDGLCADLGDALQTKFEREGGSGLYPPPNIYGLLSAYLINTGSVSSVSKHRIVQYLFLDIASILSGDKWSELIESLIKFPSAFSVPPSLIKLTQAFWLLDHEDFEEALKMLLDPLISNADIQDWQHRSILLAFLTQDQPKLALKYSRMRKPPQKDLKDIQLHVSSRKLLEYCRKILCGKIFLGEKRKR